MTAQAIRYEGTILPQLGKKGILKPDATGYYRVILGALNIHNSGNAFYDWEGSKQVFDKSQDLMRRILSNKLYSELGHPKRIPGMGRDEYLQRILTVYEANVCNHIRMIELQEEVTRAEGGKPVVVTYGEVKPFGPMGEIAEESLSSPDINTCYSIRSITFDQRDSWGRLVKKLMEVATWDLVLEPGIEIATKFDNPSLESLTRQVTELPLDVNLLLRTKDKLMTSNFGLESDAAPARMLDRMVDAAQRLDRMATSSIYLPPSAKW